MRKRCVSTLGIWLGSWLASITSNQRRGAMMLGRTYGGCGGPTGPCRPGDGSASGAHGVRGRRSRTARRTVGLCLAVALALSMAAAAPAGASCSRPPNAIWTGTAVGPRQSGTWEDYVTVSPESPPGSGVMAVEGHAEYIGQYEGLPEAFTGDLVDGIVECNGNESLAVPWTGTIGSNHYSVYVSYLGHANDTEASGTWENHLPPPYQEEGTWSGTLYAAAQSQGSQQGTVELINPAGTLAASLSAAPAPPGLPSGGVAPVGALSYEVTNVAAGTTIEVILKLPTGSTPTTVYKYVGGQYVQVPFSEAQIHGTEVALKITDNGPWDEDPTPGVIQDPLIPVYQPGPAPRLSRLTPTKGPAEGGTQVTITGTGFTGGTAVEFGSTEAKNVTVSSATSLTAESPPGVPGKVDVSVTTPNGASVISSKRHFTYKKPEKAKK